MKRGIKITERFTVGETESFKKYLSEVSSIKTFETAEDEAVCAKKAVAGDEKAMEELVKRNLRFVISVAKQYQRDGVQLEDLVNEGNFGLMHASRKFDPTTGNKFISYAVWWIRSYIQTHISNTCRTIRVPVNKNTALINFKNRINTITQKLGREASIEDLLDNIDDMSEKEILDMVNIGSLSVTSISKKLNGNDESSGTIEDVLVSDSFGPTDNIVNQNDSKAQLNRLLNYLKVRDRMVLKLYFGVDTPTPMNLHEIATELGISREGVRQIRDKSIKRLNIIAREHKVDMDMF
jgi:RNA polymerase primary sigma factor|tara:strand:+ start:18954 stop:19835 length:882 start_codon:yes stop_codon:yes gene_type:complete